MAKVAINGLGRIGRATFKILQDTHGLELVAVNDLMAPEEMPYLLRYDSVYGRYARRIERQGDLLVTEGRRCRILREKDPAILPWKDLGVDLVFECTGALTRKEDAEKHLIAGTSRVILSAPAKGKGVPTIVHGVNRADPAGRIFSCASCTTNGSTPVVEILKRRIGIGKAVMCTTHAYTSTQMILDGPSRKVRRGRAGAINLVPTETGAARATTEVLTDLEGRFDGVAIRAPVPVGSIASVVVTTSRSTTVEEVNGLFEEEADTERYRGILGASREPLVSSDVVGDSRASIVDLEMTRVVGGDLVQVLSWYDNEWGYASQMVREAKRVLEERIGPP
jgi:glyceraldehyde 3-phosphate dehydrogenase